MSKKTYAPEWNSHSPHLTRRRVPCPDERPLPLALCALFRHGTLPVGSEVPQPGSLTQLRQAVRLVLCADVYSRASPTEEEAYRAHLNIHEFLARRLGLRAAPVMRAWMSELREADRDRRDGHEGEADLEGKERE
ncbi:hypothetical protein DFH09DRAFT_1301941 [Mycena vulgaris]|nr:hypothetical protein DFH09DRAFT_1301941 [Mycena vulgaris]